MPYGINFTDEPYQIGLCENYLSAPATVLSGFVGHLINYIANGKFIVFRWATAIITILTTLTPIIYYFRRTKNQDLAILIYSILMLLQASKYSFFFGWDRVSNLALSITMVLAFEYFYSHKKAILILLAVASAIVCGCRLPNVVLIPFVMLLLAVDPNCRDLKQKLLRSTIYLVVASVVFVLMMTLFYGSIGEYMYAINSMAKVNGHGIGFIIMRYISGILPLAKVLVGQVLIYAIICVALKLKQFNHKYILYSLAIALGIMYFYWSYRHLDFYRYRISYMITSSWLLTLFFIYKNCDKQHVMQFVWISAISIVFVLIPISGTNTGLSKLATYTTFPFLLMYIKNYKRTVVVFYVVVFIGVFLSGILAKYRYNTFEDSRILDMDAEPKVAQLCGLKTTAERAKYIEDVCDKINHIKGTATIIGNRSLLFEHLYHLENEYTKQYFWRWYSDNEYVTTECKYLSENEVSTIVSASDSPIENSSILPKELNRLGYVLSDEGEDYSIYIKKLDSHE